MTNQAYKLGFSEIGEDVVIWPTAKIVSPGAVSIGHSVIIDDFVYIGPNKRIVIGSFVHIAAFVSIVGGGEFIADDFSGISGGCRVYTGNDDYLGGCLTGPTVPFPYRIPIRSYVHVKKHAIIGANTVILPGVIIGEGAAIGANSLIKDDCDPWTIYVGSPARPIRPRPQDRMLDLEAQLRKDLYDENGHFIPKCKRGQT